MTGLTPEQTITKTKIGVSLYVFLVIASLFSALVIAGFIFVWQISGKTAISGIAYKYQDGVKQGLVSFSPATTDLLTLVKINRNYRQSQTVVSSLPSLKSVTAGGSVILNTPDSYARILLGDRLIANFQYPDKGTIYFSMLCTETCALDATNSQPVTVELNDATLQLDSLAYLPASGQLKAEVQTEGASAYQTFLKDEQNKNIILAINERNIEKGQPWVAGDTGEIIQKSFADLKTMFRDNVPAKLYAALFYQDGYLPIDDFQISTPPSPEEPEEIRTDPFSFTWQNRHGINWLTSVKNQAQCGSCYAFAGIATLESYINLYYNRSASQPLPNKNLSEQDVVSCTNCPGIDCNHGCGGGSEGTTLNYFKNTGVVDDPCFPYSATDEACRTNCADNSQPLTERKWKITDWEYATGNWPTSLEAKTALQQKGPRMISLGSWNHVVSLVGFGDITPGCYWESSSSASWPCTRTISAGDPLIGKNYWLIKNSWGTSWGNGGYGKILFSNTPGGYAITAPPAPPANEPIRSVICQDDDQDGLCWWGISPTKPTTGCPDSCSNNNISDCDDTDENVGECSIQDLCGNKPAVPSGEFSSFGNYRQYGRSSCCGDGLDEYVVGDLCCNAADDIAATAVGYSVNDYTYGSSGSGDGQFSNPGGIDVNIYAGLSGLLAVADTNNHRVQIFQLAENSVTFLSTIGGYGSGDGQFNRPIDVAFSGNTLYVVDQMNYRVQLFTRQTDGAWVFFSSFGEYGTGNGQFIRPSGVSVSKYNGEDLISVSDQGAGKIKLFERDFNTITFFQSIGTQGSGNGQFSSPSDVGFYENKLYICDRDNYRIQVFQQLGDNEAYNYLSKFPATCNRLTVTFDRLYITLSSNEPPLLSTYLIIGTSVIPEVSFPQGSDYGDYSAVVRYGTQLFVLDRINARILLLDPVTWPVCKSVCTDGTPSGSCSTDKPSFCNNGTLENNCDYCGCPVNTTCRVGGTCEARNVKSPLPVIQEGRSD